MGRQRMIRPEFFTPEGLFEAERAAKLPLRVAFAGLWTQCDREGRFEWRPRRLKLAILPYDDCDCEQVLDALASGGFVVKYTVGEQAHSGSFRHGQNINVPTIRRLIR